MHQHAHYNGTYHWADLVQLLPFKCFEVKPWTQSENTLVQNEVSPREGGCNQYLPVHFH
jgi:hypothetical protein